MGWLRQLLYRRHRYDELSEAIREHLDEKVADLMDHGMTREQAETAARREFGNVTRIEERSREVWQWPTAESIFADVRFALRQLRKSPGFAVTAILTLALGIGANTAIFTLVNAVLLRSLPVQNPSQLVVFRWQAHKWPNHVGSSSYGNCGSHGHEGCSLSYPMFKEIQNREDLFSSAMAFAGPYHMGFSGNGQASIVQSELVSGNYFQTLGVHAVLGRTLEPTDEKAGSAPVAVLDYGYWQRAFGGSPAVIGRTIRLDNTVLTIVGVAEPGFTRLSPGMKVDIWAPLGQNIPVGEQQWSALSAPNHWWLTIVGRLKPGVSATQAQAAMNVWFLNATMHRAKPAWKASDNPHLTLLPAQKGLVGVRSSLGEPLLLLLAAVGVVLLITCANVAGLMLARGTAREKEIAVRMAIGAGRRRVIRQMLTESLLLSFAGAALGALLAYAGATGLAAFFAKNANAPLQINLHPNAPVLLFAIIAALLTGIGFGLAPALRASRTNITTELKEGSTTTTQHKGKARLSLGSGLVIFQVALSVVILSGTGLLLRTLENLHSINPGFDTHHLLLFSINPELVGYKKQEIPELYANLQRRLAALPGIRSVSYSSDALLDGRWWVVGVHIEGKSDKNNVNTQMLAVGTDFFSTMKIPLILGRPLRPQDISGKPSGVVVNQAFVHRFLDGKNPIGVQLSDGTVKGKQWTIVGVARNTKYRDLRGTEAPTVFVPLTDGGATFALRTANAPTNQVAAVRNAVNKIDRNLPLIRIRTQTQTIDQLLFNERLVTRLFGLFGALGLVLACIGLYGLLSYQVAQRTREIGIRTALGAQRLRVWMLVLRQGFVLVICGVAAGIVMAIGATRLLTSLLYSVRPTDAVTFTGVAGLLLIVGVVACFLPAQRAASIDPMQALRSE